MTSASPTRSFAICRAPGIDRIALEIEMTEQAQASIAELVESERTSFVNEGLARVPFDPTYQTDDESILWIDGFELPEHIRDTIDTPDEVGSFSGRDDIKKVKALLHVAANGELYFQCWRNFEALSQQKRFMFLTGDTFDVETKPSLVVSHRVDAVYSDGALLFRSVSNTSTMLDLLDYVTEATSEDIQEFVGSELFSGDAEALANCSHRQKQQIRHLVQSGALEQLDCEYLVEVANDVGYELDVQDDTVRVPNGGRELTELLRFLSEKVYLGPITGTPKVATSVRDR